MDLSALPPRGTPGTKGGLPFAERAVGVGAVATGVPAWVIGGVLLTRRAEGLPPDGFATLGLNADIAVTVACAATVGALAGLGVAVRRGAAPARGFHALLVGLTVGVVIGAPLVFAALLAGALLGPFIGGAVCIGAPLAGVQAGVRIARRSTAGELGAVPLADLPPVSPTSGRSLRWGGRPRGRAR